MTIASRLRFGVILLFAALPCAALGRAPARNAPPIVRRGVVVVVPRSLDAAVKPFVEHRRRSLPVEVAILEKVLEESPGVDDPEIPRSSSDSCMPPGRGETPAMCSWSAMPRCCRCAI
ncbi:MAG: hypothetical protein ABSG53_18110 [Thermoguttaceae bacterium]